MKEFNYKAPKGGNGRALIFDSVTECEEYTDGRVATNYAATSKGGGDLHWLGVDSEKEFDEVCANGVYPRGLEALDEMSGGFTPDPMPSIRRRRRWGADGDALDMGRVWSGQLDRAWSGVHRESRPSTGQVTLVVNLVASCGVPAEQIMWQGVAAIKAADQLTEAGYAVRILVGIFVLREGRNAKRGDNLVVLATAKDFDQPLDKAALSVTIAMAGWWRVHALKFAHDGSYQWYGMGYPSEGDMPLTNPGFAPAFEWIGGENGGATEFVPAIRSRDDAEKWFAKFDKTLREGSFNFKPAA